MKLIVLLTFLALCYGGILKKECQISVNYETGDLKEPQPLILNDVFEIVYPNKTGILTFSYGQSILLACPGNDNGFDDPLKWQQLTEASCDQDNKFKVDKKSYPFSSFTCEKTAKTVVKRKGSCLENSSKIEIGYKTLETFIPIIEVCRDDKTDEPYYAKSKMTNSIGGSQRKIPRPDWMSDYLFHGNRISRFFRKKHQLYNLETILKSKKLAQRYMKKNQLVRGQLVSKIDLVYKTEQTSTFSLANVAPQWSSFKNGSWKHIEKAIRNFVVDNNLNVTIYTGIHGQMTLRDINNNEQPIYLNIDENNNGYIKVPKFFWKLIYDPIHHLALAIIGVNDPFRDKITEDMVLCPDISDNPSVGWLTKHWNSKMEILYGVFYVCEYKDLQKVVHTVPNLKVKGIL